MKIPARAFAQLHPKDLGPGRLFKFQGSWALRVFSGDGLQGFLMLEGERAGSALRVDAGMAQSVAIVEPFNWFPMVPADAKATLEADRTLTLTLTADGPVIVAADARDSWGRTFIAFTPDGQGDEVQEPHPLMRFEQWSLELCHKDRPYVSLGTLLEIDRRKKS